jgi:Cdc6-like AAA superfamily ATPase
MTVECNRCGKEETKPLPESITVNELNDHLCDACKDLEESEAADDGMTMAKLHDLIHQTTGVRIISGLMELIWRDYLNQNLNGVAISSADFIDSLGINAWES